jgi:hypothetical protein
VAPASCRRHSIAHKFLAPSIPLPANLACEKAVFWI